VAGDEEHAKLLLAAQAARKADSEPGEYHPPLTRWTPEVEALAAVVDELRLVRHILTLANSDPKKSKPKMPPLYARPVTALGRLRPRMDHQRRKAKHEALTARLLPNRPAE
jgi:hypothetical protein